MRSKRTSPRGHLLGQLGEREAERFLRRAGLRVVARGFRCRAGEIDLILRDGDTLVFAEVKTRCRTDWGTPAEAVGWRKRARIVRTAYWFLARFAGDPPPCRFDVVEVLWSGDREVRVRHIADAFRL